MFCCTLDRQGYYDEQSCKQACTQAASQPS
jgi:hypothetical protein